MRESAQLGRARFRVVVVEDQTAVREMIIQVVQTNPNCQVVAETGDGYAACDLCLQTKPDLIILDIMLPGLHGTEVLRRLRKTLPGARVLVFSGYQNPALVRNLLYVGADGFVEKTAALADLKEGIRTVAEGGSYFGPEVARMVRDILAGPDGKKIPSLELLTGREREVLKLIAESHSTKEIAAKIGISVKTADNHRTNLMKKLDAHDTAALTRFAIGHGLVEPSGQPSIRP